MRDKKGNAGEMRDERKREMQLPFIPAQRCFQSETKIIRSAFDIQK